MAWEPIQAYRGGDIPLPALVGDVKGDEKVRAAIDRLVKAQKELDQAAHLARLARERLASGGASPGDLVIAQTRLDRARDWLRLAGQDVKAARQSKLTR